MLKIAWPRAIDARRLFCVLPDRPAQALNTFIAFGLNAVPNGLPPCESLMPKNVCCVRSGWGPPVAPARFSAPATLSRSWATTRFIWKSMIDARTAAVRCVDALGVAAGRVVRLGQHVGPHRRADLERLHAVTLVRRWAESG